MTPLDLVLHRLAEHVPVRNGSSQRCPAHEDRSPSLSVTQGATGVVLHCHAGCTTEDVLDVLGLTYPDLRDGTGAAVVAPVNDAPAYDPSELLAWRDACHEHLLHGDAAAPARAYLEERGVTEELVRTYRLGFALPHDDERLDALGGRLLAIGPRIVKGRVVPGVRPASTPRASWRNARSAGGVWRIEDIDPALPVVAVEGVFDVLGVHRIAPGQAIALGGKTLKPGDARRLVRRGVERLHLSLDRDASAEDWRRLVEGCVSVGIAPVILRGPRRGDWGDTLTVPDDLYFPCASVAFSNWGAA